MGYPMILEKDYGFGTVIHSRQEMFLALQKHRDSLTEAEQEEIWLYARDWERREGLAGDLSRFSTAIENIEIVNG